MRPRVPAELLDRYLGSDGETDALVDVWRLAVYGVDDRRAGRTADLQGQASVPRDEHEAVEKECVLSILEQLGEADRPRLAVARRFLEAVVGRHLAAEGQAASLCPDCLDLPAELDLGLEQLVAGAAIIVCLARKPDAV